MLSLPLPSFVIVRIPAFVPLSTLPPLTMSKLEFVLANVALPLLLSTSPLITKPPKPSFVILSSEPALYTVPAILSLPLPSFVIVRIPAFVPLSTLPPARTSKSPAAFVNVALPLSLSTSPEMLRPFAPEFVMSRLLPEFVTVPLISNVLFVFVRSVSPFVLVTLPLIINPPSPLLFISRPVPLFVTIAPVCTFNFPSPLLLIVSFAPLLLTSPPVIISKSLEVLVKVALPLSLSTSPSMLNPPSPALSIVSSAPVLITFPGTFKAPLPLLLIASLSPLLFTSLLISKLPAVFVKVALPLSLSTSPSTINPPRPSFVIFNSAPSFNTVPAMLSLPFPLFVIDKLPAAVPLSTLPPARTSKSPASFANVALPLLLSTRPSTVKPPLP